MELNELSTKDEIYLITLNSDDEQIETRMTVDELINRWKNGTDIPCNDDPIVSCLFHSTQLYLEDFGELMSLLTGESL